MIKLIELKAYLVLYISYYFLPWFNKVSEYLYPEKKLKLQIRKKITPKLRSLKTFSIKLVSIKKINGYFKPFR